MEKSNIVINSTRKNDTFAIVGFILGIVSILFFPLILMSAFLFLNGWDYVEDPLGGAYIGDFRLNSYLIAFAPVIPLTAAILSAIGMKRIRSNKEKKGFWFAATGFILALVVLIFSIWSGSNVNIGIL